MNRRWTGTALVLALMMSGRGTIRAAEAKPTADEIKKLVEDLGAASKDNVTRAKKRLAEIGPAALAGLRDGIAKNKKEPLAKAAQSVVEEIARQSQKKLEARLAERKSTGAIVSWVSDESVGQVFPAHLVLAVRFRQFPIAIRPRAPLKSQNLFIVHPDGQMEHLTDFKGLEEFFREKIGRVFKAAEAKTAARAWLCMSQELSQDGFFKFSIPEDALRISKSTMLEIIGKAMVKPEMGNKGFIEVTISFEIDGMLAGISEKKNLLRGIRPKCQATKLLDPDAVVRAMAEQDILVMGRAAKEYLTEQRAQASPALRREIDRMWKQILDEGR